MTLSCNSHLQQIQRKENRILYEREISEICEEMVQSMANGKLCLWRMHSSKIIWILRGWHLAWTGQPTGSEPERGKASTTASNLVHFLHCMFSLEQARTQAPNPTRARASMWCIFDEEPSGAHLTDSRRAALHPSPSNGAAQEDQNQG